MKQNIAILGTSGKINKEVGKLLADKLGMHYLDYDEYIEYLALMPKKEILKSNSKSDFKTYQVSKLDGLSDYENSLFALPSGICNTSSEVAIIAKGAYTIYLSKRRVCSKITSQCLLVLDTERYNTSDIIVDKIIEKLGEIYE